jgi:hypothetical protein
MVMGSSPSAHVLYVYTGFQCPRISKPCRSAALASRFPTPIGFSSQVDGFRSLVRIDSGVCKLMSRNGNQFKSFSVLNEAIIYWDAQATESGKSAVIPRKASVLLYVLDVKGELRCDQQLCNLKLRT